MRRIQALIDACYACLLDRPPTHLHRDIPVRSATHGRGMSRSPRIPRPRRRSEVAVYTLTRICSVEYTKSVESVFDIIAEPNRRAILSLLVSCPQSVGAIERQLGMPQPTVSKHLRVLREAGFVESTVDA